MQTWEAPLHRFSRNSFPQRLSTKNYLEYWITADISPATFNDAEFTTKKKKYLVQFAYMEEHSFPEAKVMIWSVVIYS